VSILSGALTLYSWIVVAALIYLLIRIERFYTKKYTEIHTYSTKYRAYSALFLAPLLLFLFAAARYAWRRDLAGDVPSDLALFVGGAVLAVSSYHLYRLLTRRTQG
jgi:predicted exporter